MNQKLSLTCLIIFIFTIAYLLCKPKEILYEAKWDDTNTLAITIDGEISTTFPTTNLYEGIVSCITGTGTVSWNGSKWMLTTSGITKGSTKCNIKFNKLKAFAGTILANNEVKTPTTTPGSAISASDEALLASAEDDYGISYYFRGAVTNNYVEFANKCWRIVRIGGDNTVKLILHNDNTAGVSNSCSSSNNNATAAFAHYNGSTYTSAFNSLAYYGYDNAYVGFMYGTPGSSTYEATHANTNKSTVLTNLETWYNNNLKSYESVIDDNVFCNDKTVVTDTSYDPWNFSPAPTGLGYGKNKTYYGATQRILSSSNTAGGTGPSLKCNGELSKITSKIGLITADELTFAGYAAYTSGSTSYLLENATGAYWWSLSPTAFNGSFTYAWIVEGSSDKLHFMGLSSERGVRPYISLKFSTKVLNGSGTSEDPYKVSM